MIFVGDMETADLSQWQTRQLPKSHSGAPVSSQVREGLHALRISLQRGDTLRQNSEVMPKANPSFPTFVNNYNLGEEYWYAISIYLPGDWVVDSEKETLFQFHARPDTHLGEEHTRPPLALSVLEGNWQLTVRADTRRVLKKSHQQELSKTWTLGPIAPGIWSDWVFRIKWSYGDDGILQVWKDGQLVAERYGMNTYNDQIGPYLKLGIYKHAWIRNASLTNRREVYFDSLRIMRGASSYETMVAK